MVHRIRGQFRAQRRYLRWLEDHLGDYPFDHLGMVVQDGDVATLESLGAPVYGSTSSRAGFPEQARTTIIHDRAPVVRVERDHPALARRVAQRGVRQLRPELVRRRPRKGDVEERFLAAYAALPAGAFYWTVPPGDPGPGRRNLFRTVYSRGAMTLAALRTRIGAPAFEEVLRRWGTEHRNAYGTTAGFVALAEEVSGQDLGSFFREWLYDPDRPDPTPANGFPS